MKFLGLIESVSRRIPLKELCEIIISYSETRATAISEFCRACISGDLGEVHLIEKIYESRVFLDSYKGTSLGRVYVTDVYCDKPGKNYRPKKIRVESEAKELEYDICVTTFFAPSMENFIELSLKNDQFEIAKYLSKKYSVKVNELLRFVVKNPGLDELKLWMDVGFSLPIRLEDYGGDEIITYDQSNLLSLIIDNDGCDEFYIKNIFDRARSSSINIVNYILCNHGNSLGDITQNSQNYKNFHKEHKYYMKSLITEALIADHLDEELEAIPECQNLIDDNPCLRVCEISDGKTLEICRTCRESKIGPPGPIGSNVLLVPEILLGAQNVVIGRAFDPNNNIAIGSSALDPNNNTAMGLSALNIVGGTITSLGWI